MSSLSRESSFWSFSGRLGSPGEQRRLEYEEESWLRWDESGRVRNSEKEEGPSLSRWLGQGALKSEVKARTFPSKVRKRMYTFWEGRTRGQRRRRKKQLQVEAKNRARHTAVVRAARLAGRILAPPLPTAAGSS